MVGISSLASAAKGKGGLDILTVCVLTSDDGSFSTALTGSVARELKESLAQAYAEAAQQQGRPSLVLTYGPLLEHISGNTFVGAISPL